MSPASRPSESGMDPYQSPSFPLLLLARDRQLGGTSLFDTSANQSSCRVRVEEFDWDGEVPVEVGAGPFDVILGTDVAYHERLYKPLIQVGRRDYLVSLYSIRRCLPSTRLKLGFEDVIIFA